MELRSGERDGDVGEGAGAIWHQQIEKIIHSEAFRDRDSLKCLLIYLADRTTHGTADSLKEYTIGVEVFHKRGDYDPRRDGSVRQQVGKLRQKLEKYYHTEGVSDPIWVELPKGHFRLIFQHREPSHAGRTMPTGGWMAIACLVLLLPISCWVGWHSGRPSVSELDPAVRLLWAPFLDSAKHTVVCLGTPLFLRGGKFRVRYSELNSTEPPEAQAKVEDLGKKLGVQGFVPTFEFTRIGEAYAAVAIARVFAEAHHEAALTRSNVLPWNDIKDENVVFLGPTKFNPHLHAMPMNLELAFGPGKVINAHPRAGESSAYGRIADAEDNTTEDYVLIDRLPGIDPSCTVLILEGASRSGAWAAADYITRPATAKELVSRIKSPDGRIPQFFQVLLDVKYEDSVPTKTSFVTFRALNPR